MKLRKGDVVIDLMDRTNLFICKYNHKKQIGFKVILHIEPTWLSKLKNPAKTIRLFLGL